PCRALDFQAQAISPRGDTIRQTDGNVPCVRPHNVGFDHVQIIRQHNLVDVMNAPRCAKCGVRWCGRKDMGLRDWLRTRFASNKREQPKMPFFDMATGRVVPTPASELPPGEVVRTVIPGIEGQVLMRLNQWHDNLVPLEARGVSRTWLLALANSLLQPLNSAPQPAIPAPS